MGPQLIGGPVESLDRTLPRLRGLLGGDLPLSFSVGQIRWQMLERIDLEENRSRRRRGVRLSDDDASLLKKKNPLSNN